MDELKLELSTGCQSPCACATLTFLPWEVTVIVRFSVFQVVESRGKVKVLQFWQTGGGFPRFNLSGVAIRNIDPYES